MGDVPVVAIKSNFGNSGPASGAVEIVGTICGMQQHVLPVVRNFTEHDDSCPVNPVVNGVMPRNNTAAVKIGFANTGQLAAVVLTAG